MTTRLLRQPDRPDPDCYVKPSIAHLLALGLDAITRPPLDPITSFLGPVDYWLPPYEYYSEFKLLDLGRLGRLANWLIAVSMPSFTGNAPHLAEQLLPPVITNLLWQPTEILPPPYHHNCVLPMDQQWFFINGIMTNSDVAKMNADCLTYLFRRPITLIQNSTDGALLDVVETFLGKEWYQNTESATVAFPAIYCALKDKTKKRVVVISHSQGTIITAVVLRALKALGQLPEFGDGGTERYDERRYYFEDEVQLRSADFEPLSEEEWAKLELYCFANCANEMRYHRSLASGGVPWIESYGNEYDFVARLGMLAPELDQQHVAIDGPYYMRPGTRGHLLNQYYLLPIAQCQHIVEGPQHAHDARPFSLYNPEKCPWAETPRLFGYLDGDSPPALEPASAARPDGQPAAARNGQQA